MLVSRALPRQLLLISILVSVAGAGELKRRGLIGIRLSPVTDQLAEQLSLASRDGIVVLSVIEGSAAEQAGLQANDVVIKVGGEPAPDFNRFGALLRGYGGGDAVTLTLLRAGETIDKRLTLGERPRESSDEFDVVYDEVLCGAHRLRTILTRPKDAAAAPAVLLLPSLNNQTLEFQPQGAHPFKFLLYELTKAGFVTLRVDLPGVGDSEGGPAQDATVADHVRAFRSALDTLREYPFVDRKRVFLFGHGGGGALAALTAEGAPLAGVAVYGVFARPPAEFFPEALVRTWKLAAYEDDEIERRAAAVRKFVAACFGEKRTPAAIFEAQPELREIVAESLGVGDYISGRHYLYWQDLTDLNLAGSWKKLAAPTLVLWGEADFNTSREDHELIARMVKAGVGGAPANGRTGAAAVRGSGVGGGVGAGQGPA